MPGAVPVGSVSNTALHQAHHGSGPTSVFRQTTARLRRSLSRPVTPVETQVDSQAQLRRVVYRQNRNSVNANGGNGSNSHGGHRRRLVETFRSLSQVGQSPGMGGNGFGGGIGGVGVFRAAGARSAIRQ